MTATRVPEDETTARFLPSRRVAALAVAGFLVVLLAAIAALLPVPYVLLGPGPTANTLGTNDGKPLISIVGHTTYPTAGRLDLLTVEVAGGPGRKLDLVRALRGWLDPNLAVLPEEQVYPKGETEQEIETENAHDMTESQQDATAAALTYLKIPITQRVVVEQVEPKSPAAKQLKPGDLITSVDGTPVTTADQLRNAITAHRPGDTVTVKFKRDGRSRVATVTTEAAPSGPKRAVIGVTPGLTFEFPFTVRIQIEDVGGPSAGMMFALGIIDKLTPGQLNGGHYIAGTGTISPGGEVGPIGGIQQKMIAAHDKGAELFLAPAGNCAQVRADKPDGLHVVKVSTLTDSVNALKALQDGKADSLPTCAR